MRVKFKKEEEREEFFKKILKENFKSWREFSEYLKIDRKLFLEYRSGSLTIPLEIYEKSIILLKEKEKNKQKRIITKINDNWGKIKGGKRNYELNKEIFDKGRNKAIRISKSKVKRFNIFIDLTKEISYIVGLFIGDGFSNKYQRHYLTQFIGHYSELEYYKNIIAKEIFNFTKINPIIKEYNKKYIRINYYSKDLHDFFIKRFKIKAGRKSYSVLIPQEIVNSSDEVICSCIAGIYDAEASFYFDKRNRYKEPYPIIDFHINNPSLGKQISDLLNDLKIKHYTRKNNNKTYIYGKKNIQEFLKKIKIKNPKLLEKIPKSYISN